MLEEAGGYWKAVVCVCGGAYVGTVNILIPMAACYIGNHGMCTFLCAYTSKQQ